ncbi:MAG: hypothetical protein AB8B56_01025 [Crocinitomicaceae bacterium]
MKFEFDIYTPLDSENSKAETSQKKWLGESEFMGLFEEFKWSDYLASPTLSVYYPNSKVVLWVSLYATSDDNDEMFIIGYHRQVPSRGFLGLGRIKEKEKITTYFVVGRDGVRDVFSEFFKFHFESMEQKLKKFDSELG